MYLHKSAQYQLGEYPEKGNLCKGILAFMVVGLKQSTPFVDQTISEVTFNGQWLAEKTSDNIYNLIEIGLCVQGIVTNNISNKVYLSAISIYVFSAMIKITL